MRPSVPVRTWLAGEAILVGAISLAAGLGLADGPTGGSQLGPPLAVLVIGLLGFLTPAAIGLRVPGARARRVFWLGSCVPAALWLPALPYVLLRTGTSLASAAGLLVASASLLGAILVVTGAVLTAIEVPQASG